MPARPRDKTLTERLVEDGAPLWAITLAEEMGTVKTTLGEPSEDGENGTGLVGDMIKLKTKMDGLMSLKAHGVGLLAGVVLVLAIVTFGVKGAFAALLGKLG